MLKRVKEYISLVHVSPRLEFDSWLLVQCFVLFFQVLITGLNNNFWIFPELWREKREIQSKFSTFCLCTLELELGISIYVYICDSASVSVQLACAINSVLKEKKKQEDGAKTSKSKRKVDKSKPTVPTLFFVWKNRVQVSRIFEPGMIKSQSGHKFEKSEESNHQKKVSV